MHKTIKIMIDIPLETPPKKEPETTIPKIANKGTGAGGANTNLHGKHFENKTFNGERLLGQGYIKKGNYLEKKCDDKSCYFMEQRNLKYFMKQKYNKDVFRCPDEAYIYDYGNGRVTVIILEKKEQRVEGSVETKLWSGPSLKREYELLLGDGFVVYYGFCVSEFLKKKLTSAEKKYTTLNTILNESGIAVLFGDDDDYFAKLDAWIDGFL